MRYDDIIVGAGSAGAALAARLAEDSTRSVLLMEAGPDYPTVEQIPPSLLDPRQVGPAEFDWGYLATAVPGREVAVPRGKVTGGSSAVNGAMALRGVPADYDEWAAEGNAAWSWKEVLPYFRRLEDDHDERGDFHGTGGPIPVRRAAMDALLPLQRAFFDACRALGFPEARDHNDPGESGVGPWPMNVREGVRVSTAIGYLLPARHRLNLTIRSDCLASRVLFDGSRAVGVEAECGRLVQQVLGGRITLAAGAYASPALLLRSGIGPVSELRALGIEPRVDLPAVGRNLIEHAQLGVNLLARPGVLQVDDPMYQVALRYTAPASVEVTDMQLYLFHFPESGTMRLSVVLQRPRSRGHLRLGSADPHMPPLIELNLAHDPEDVRRLADGMRLIWTVAQSPGVGAFLEGTVMLDDGVVMQLTEAAASLTTDTALERYVARGVSQFYHPVGTARMGPTGDPGAVVDQHGRVRGVDGLRIVDASVMPTIPRANTNLTCIMIAERMADWMRNEP